MLPSAGLEGGVANIAKKKKKNPEYIAGFWEVRERTETDRVRVNQDKWKAIH